MLQCGINPGYVLDEMEFYEINAILANLYLKDKSSWEQTREIGYITAQCQSSKRIDPKEFMVFPWEKEEEPEVTEEDREEMIRELREMENKMNNR